MKSLFLSTGPAIWLRSLTRRLGLNRLLSRWLDRGDYEEAFNSSLMGAISPGDTVWDVGANVGHYTREFAKKTGATGCVVAFEPVPACFAELQSVCRHLPQVRLVNVALGSRDQLATMKLAADPLGVTHRLNTEDGQPGEMQTVSVRSAQSIVEERPDGFPSVVKIDVEGYEEAVLQGFGEFLSDPRLRAIGVEIHFAVLESNGDSRAPRRIEKVLNSHGLRPTWTDRSHIVATRQS